MRRWLPALLMLICATPVGAVEHLERLEADGYVDCVPRGRLAELLAGAPGCAMDFDACPMATIAAAGPLPSDVPPILIDLLSMEGGTWRVRCPEDGPRYLHQMAIEGLGFGGDHVEVLLALADPELLPAMGRNVRLLVSEALFWARDASAALGAARLLETDARPVDFKAMAVLTLARWKDPAGAEFCAGRLDPDDDDELAAACLHYLATVKAKGARALLEKALRHHPTAAVRALGTLGDKDALPAVRRFAATYRGKPALRIPALVTLVVLGDDAMLGRLLHALRGPEKLRKERVARARKRAARAKKRSKRRRRSRRRKRKKKKPPSKRARKRLMGMLTTLDNAHRVAMEVTRITEPAHRARLRPVLWSAARAEFPFRWKAHTYALLALAQMGDPKALDRFAVLLREAVDPIRTVLVEVAGGLYLDRSAPGRRRGLGLIAHRPLVPLLIAVAEDADTHAQRVLALRAALVIRTLSPP